MRAMILARNRDEREPYLQNSSVFQQEDLLALFKVMDGLPVTVRLLDPPLHEFLPHGEDDVIELATRNGRSADEVREAAGPVRGQSHARDSAAVVSRWSCPRSPACR